MIASGIFLIFHANLHVKYEVWKLRH